MKTSEEIVKLLTPWKESYLILDKAADALVAVGFEPEAPIIEAAWKTFDALTARLEAELGDEHESLDWFAHENQMGKRGHQAGLFGDLRAIRTLEDLAWLLKVPTPVMDGDHWPRARHAGVGGAA